MNKLRIVALALVCVMVFTGCTLVSPNEEKIAGQVVATVNGEEIYRHQVDEMVEMYAASYGIDPESTDENMQAAYEELKRSVLDSLITNELMLQKAPELGITLTDEEIQSNKDQADDLFVSRKEEIRNLVEEEAKVDASIDVEAESAARYEDFVQSMDSTPESYAEYLNEMAIVTDVQTYMYEQADLPEQEIKDWYDNALEVQQDEMENNPQAFEAYVHQRNIYTYVPEKTIAVKQVLLTFKDEELVAQATELYSAGQEEAAMEVLQPEIDKVMPEAVKAKLRLDEGEALDDVIADVGEDPAMTEDPTNVYGYLVGESTERYLPEFSEAALALENVGDTSEPVITYYGIHILQNIKVYEEGVIPYEDAKDQIIDALRPEKEQAKFTEMDAQWKEEAEIVYYYERLMN